MTAPTKYMKSGTVVRGWTEDDDARLVDWIVAGHPQTRIAEALGRSESAVHQRRIRLRDRIEARRASDGVARAEWPVARAALVPDPCRAAGDVRRRLQARLAALPRGTFWTAARDLALARAMAAGVPTARLARDWQCEPTDVSDRWMVLCPDRAQAGVVAALIALLDEEVADA